MCLAVSGGAVQQHDGGAGAVDAIGHPRARDFDVMHGTIPLIARRPRDGGSPLAGQATGCFSCVSGSVVSQGAAGVEAGAGKRMAGRSEEHTSELQSLMRISYAVFCLKKKKTTDNT